MALPPKPRKNSLRLEGYDYASSGGYFVTICTHEKARIFGNIVEGDVVLSVYGTIVKECWDAIPQHFEQVALDMYVVMPNHIHGIILIYDKTESVGAKHVSPLQPTEQAPSQPIPKAGSPPKSVSAIISSFKASVTREIRKQYSVASQQPIWQRGFYDHVMRNEDDLRRIQQYIYDNPLKWESDDYY